jgi:uncharacterized membrane protein YkgB
MSRGIGEQISENMQLQQFVEVVLSYVYDNAEEEDIEYLADEMGESPEVVEWCFNCLGYKREEE